MDPVVDAALRRARHLYLTTYGRSGRSGTVPVWFWYAGGCAYFTTLRESLKARRVRSTGRVTVRVGRDGPAFEGRAEWVDGRPDLEAALLQAYRRKYWLVVLGMGRVIRRRLAAGRSVLVRITPAEPPSAPAAVDRAPVASLG